MRILKKIEKLFGETFYDSSLENYSKIQGFKATVSMKNHSGNWPDLVYMALQKAQLLANEIQVFGFITESVDLFLGKIKIPGVDSIEVYLARPGV